MTKQFISTRNNQKPLNFYQAIVQGIGDDGGLLVPNFEFAKVDLESLMDLSYIDLATKVLSTFVDEGGEKLIREACEKAYGPDLFPGGVAPVKKVGDLFIAELFHGRTAAFKDVALSILPHFMTLSLKELNEEREVKILAATSGDTGKAALEGFKDVPGTSMSVFYPMDGVSAIQKQQMITQTGSNLEVVGITGNFDNAQTAVKQAFNSQELASMCEENNVLLSSANSINIGRLIPQIIYYFSSYQELVNNNEITLGEEINFCIPSGNFGNCLAGYFAKTMGLPVKQFIVASNNNNVLTDFFSTGKYDINRDFYKTIAPAMDILISSNLERLVWFMEDGNGEKVAQYMQGLVDNGVYQVSDETFAKIKETFKAGFLNEQEVMKTIKDCYEATGYLLDTHTACGYGVLQRETVDTKTVLLSTASPYKFPESVYEALTGKQVDVYEAIELLNKMTNVEIPQPLLGIKERNILHKKTINKEDIISYIESTITKE